MICFVEIEGDDGAPLTALERVVAALAHAKEAGEWHDDDHWIAFFDEAARTRFWWPTDSERADYFRRWRATPAATRRTDPSLRVPWDFGSIMIDAFRNGDYRIIGVRRIRSGVARLEFDPLSDPYGGTGCMIALVEA